LRVRLGYGALKGGRVTHGIFLSRLDMPSAKQLLALPVLSML
jgi:hypothetical protein